MRGLDDQCHGLSYSVEKEGLWTNWESILLLLQQEPSKCYPSLEACITPEKHKNYCISTKDTLVMLFSIYILDQKNRKWLKCNRKRDFSNFSFFIISMFFLTNTNRERLSFQNDSPSMSQILSQIWSLTVLPFFYEHPIY